jgi:hypothetical protein
MRRREGRAATSCPSCPSCPRKNTSTSLMLYNRGALATGRTPNLIGLLGHLGQRGHYLQGIIPAALSSLVIRRSSAFINLTRETWAADRRPCLVLAAATRALPSAVLGPVLLPPCIRQRFFSLMAGFWQSFPLRVLARQRWPGQLGPSRLAFCLKERNIY